MTSTEPDHPDNATLTESQSSQHVEPADSTPLAGESSLAADANDDLSDVRDEESISDYMERLLTRVNRLTSSDDQASSQSAEAIRVEKHSHSYGTASTNGQPSESFGAAPKEAPGQRFGTTRRALPPESRGDLVVLRDLANETSRDAIDIHSRQQTISTALGNLWVTMVASVISILLLELSSPGRLLVCASAAVSVIVTMVFALGYLNQTRLLSGQLRPFPLQELTPEITTDSDPIASSQDEHRESE